MLKHNKDLEKISVIIPVYNSFLHIPEILDNLNNQTYLPSEVIIVDSSTENLTKNYLNNKKFKFNIIYKKTDSVSYPGKSRNIGIKIASGTYLSFIDSKTIPDIYWIEESLNSINNSIKCIIGGVSVRADSFFQKILRSTSYGIQNNETLVGTIIEAEFFKKVGFFNENCRAGEDIDWLNRLKHFKDNYCKRNNSNIEYTGLPKNINDTIKKYIIYSYHTSKIEVLQNVKNLYLILTLLIFSILIPKVSFYIQNFDNKLIFFNNFTQIFVIFSISIILIILIVEISFSIKNKKNHFNLYLFIILCILFYYIYNWNNIIALWIEDAVLYVPHITKKFFIVIFLLSFFVRGILVPLSKDIKLNFIFPINWLIIGSLGVILDTVKAPFYIFGSITHPFIKIINISLYKDKYQNFDKKKLLILCPFPEGVQAGQRLKYEQHFDTFRKNNFLIEIKPFINHQMWNILYTKGHYIEKFFGMISGYIKRFFTIFLLFKYDIVYVFMWITPYGPGWFERIYRFFSKKIIYDIEDNILIVRKNEINPTSRFKSVGKILYLIKYADQIITSAPSLNERCKAISLKNNCTYICASINMKRYIPNIEYNNDNILTLGWTGTFSSQLYLKIVEPTLKELAKIRKFKLRIIGNFDYHIDGVDYEIIQWSKSSEIEDLTKIDIGFYPLNMDTEWVSGKSGLKALQYMALGIPTIATDIGNVSSIINHMDNGMLVKSNEEWLQSFIKLIDYPNLRKKLGVAGRKTVIDNYSTDILTNKYLKVLKSNLE